MPSGLWTSQNILATWASLRQGMIWNVLGSGRATMSDSWIRAKPSMEEPSKPMPSASAPSSSCGVMANDFRKPRTSVNQSRMNRIPRSSAVRRTYSASLESATATEGSEPVAGHGYAWVNFGGPADRRGFGELKSEAPCGRKIGREAER